MGSIQQRDLCDTTVSISHDASENILKMRDHACNVFLTDKCSIIFNISANHTGFREHFNGHVILRFRGFQIIFCSGQITETKYAFAHVLEYEHNIERVADLLDQLLVSVISVLKRIYTVFLDPLD